MIYHKRGFNLYKKLSGSGFIVTRISSFSWHNVIPLTVLDVLYGSLIWITCSSKTKHQVHSAGVLGQIAQGGTNFECEPDCIGEIVPYSQWELVLKMRQKPSWTILV